jgi:hypothetical protein
MAKLPPIPVGVPPGHSYWNDWYEKLRNLINSSLLNHNDLLNIQGGTPLERYHLTAAEHTALTSNNWQYVQLTSDFTTNSTTPVDITGLSFTPAANKTYMVEAMLMMRTSDATKGPQPGVAFPTGMNSSAFRLSATNTTSTEVILNSNSLGTLNITNTGFPDNTTSYPGILDCTFTTGASPSGDFKLRMSAQT